MKNEKNTTAICYDWTKFRNSPIYADILSTWETMLDNTNLKEQDYQSYLQDHPAVFLAIQECYLVISRLKLGSDYETDFVTVKEGYSNGTEYELIEIESPHTALFDRTGKPTAKFNAALQQIRDWKRLLMKDKYLFHKTFPTDHSKILRDSKLSFKIIIGRRTGDMEELEKRRQIAEQENIEIISFDRLTDLARNRQHYFDHADIYSGQMDAEPFHKRNALGNPFYTCMGDSQWRKICNTGHHHFYTGLLDEILQCRTYNSHFERFKQLGYDFGDLNL